MTNISINSGQGVTQAIAQNLGLSKEDCKKINLSTWQSVMTLVDQANTQGLQNKKTSIFGGGNNVQSIGDKSSWKSNFQVQAGQTMQIDDNIFSKIKQLLTSSKSEQTPQTQTVSQTGAASSVSQTTSAQGAAKTSATQSVSENSGVYKAKNPVLVENTPLEGDAKTGKAAAQMLDNMLTDTNAEISITSDSWRELAAKPNKSAEDIKQLNTEYNANIQKLGNSMTKYISETFANGGDIDSAAFMKFQNSGATDLSGLTAEQQAELKNSNDIAFKRIDLNGDGKIDQKEMSAFMHALDFDENNKMGGTIKSEDYFRAASQLDDPNQNLMDKKLAYCYNKLYGNEES